MNPQTVAVRIQPQPTEDRHAGLRRPFSVGGVAAVLLLSLAPAAGAQVYTLGDQLLRPPETTFSFGRILADGDFDDDGFADLAAGSPLVEINGQENAGELLVWSGSEHGLAGSPAHFHEGLSGLPGVAAANEKFASVLAAGDFNGDGFADLAVGTPDEDVTVGTSLVDDAGIVDVLYGSPSGLQPAGAQVWSQQSSGIAGIAEEEDFFGFALAAGDFDDDGFSDLAIAAPGEGIDAVGRAGAVWILFGSAAGLSATDSFWFDEADAGGALGENVAFGSALATGDFDDDDLADLAIGVPAEPAGGHVSAGAVWVIFGTVPALQGGEAASDAPELGARALVFPGLQLYQGRVLPFGVVPGAAEDFDSFGASLAVGDFNRVDAQSPRLQDLAIGSPYEDGGRGEVTVLHGSSATGITTLNSLTLAASVSPVPSAGANFGAALLAANLHGIVRADLVIGAFDQTVSSVEHAGRAFVVPGGPQGLVVAATQVLDATVAGLEIGPPHLGQRFGDAFASGNFDGRGAGDLAIGVTGEPLALLGTLGGGIEILYSALFNADFETADRSQWSSSVP